MERELLGGFVRIIEAPAKADAPESGIDAIALTWSNGRPALDHLLALSSRVAARPELHCFYRTARDSLVLVCTLDSDKDARMQTLVDGRATPLRIGRAGATHWVYADGHASNNRTLSALSGDWLLERLPWSIPAADPAAASEGGNPRWLLESPTAHRVELTAPGIWQTWNGSIVSVSRRESGKWAAVVLTGGAPGSSPKLGGGGNSYAPGSSYSVSESGAISLIEGSEEASMMSTVLLLSGLALRTPVAILDQDGKFVWLVGYDRSSSC
jgi:hypothetical protein